MLMLRILCLPAWFIGLIGPLGAIFARQSSWSYLNSATSLDFCSHLYYFGSRQQHSRLSARYSNRRIPRETFQFFCAVNLSGSDHQGKTPFRLQQSRRNRQDTFKLLHGSQSDQIGFFVIVFSAPAEN